ncbi:hypothetical protein B0J17DRAFT_707799 [Rhizoctonia solani]|nr:hypothetical protein B0J17DRAFT_707799 [Rhizoctonia solani]
MSSQSSVHTDYDTELGLPAFSAVDSINLSHDIDKFGYTELEWFEATMALSHWESKNPNYTVVTNVTKEFIQVSKTQPTMGRRVKRRIQVLVDSDDEEAFQGFSKRCHLDSN